MRRRVEVCALMGVFALVMSCTGAIATPRDGAPVVGEWNGLRAPVEPDNAGQFTVAGVHFRDHGGPVRIGEVPDSMPAQYVGKVQGDQLTLRVIVGTETLGPFTLKRGGASRLLKCL